MKKKDFLWFLLFPVYLSTGTIRHEGSHAFGAIPEGPPEFTKMNPDLAAELIETLSGDQNGYVRTMVARGLREFTEMYLQRAPRLVEELGKRPGRH